MNILGIETSCDETGVAVVVDGVTIRANEVASQVAKHAAYGGVVPEIASREHTRVISQLTERAIAQADGNIHLIAATVGPGLMGSLLVGVNFAKALAYAWGVPFVPVHHIEGHIFSPFLAGSPPQWPALALIVSGGHTQLIHCAGEHCYQLLATTRDDAVGEAFDKVARLLNLPYPGGPAIQHAAEGGDPKAFAFPRAFRGTDNLEFSYSGLKTAVLYALQDNPAADVAAVAASFQAAAVDVLLDKTKRALQLTGAPRLIVAGGVAANALLRDRLQSEIDVPVHVPPLPLCMDNGAMIAAAGFWRFKNGFRGTLDDTPSAGLSLVA